MFAIKLDLVLYFIFFHVCNCQRRIHQGLVATSEKRFVVYLVKAPIATSGYDYWLCGGALVTSDLVVTSAACIKDVDYLYVIAGYNKYVVDREIEFDPCTSKMKKKVIFTCFPDGYDFRTDRLDKWSLIDVAVIKVESPYDFNDQSYKTLCSYIPAVIPISYEARYQEAGTDAIVFGWGHLLSWRKEKDKQNHNQRELNYASVMIIDKEECKKHYTDYINMTEVIDKYMICTLGSGNIDDGGQLIEKEDPKYNGCTRRKSLKYVGGYIEECEEEEEGDSHYPDMPEDRTRRDNKRSNNSRDDLMVRKENKNVTKITRFNRTAVNGVRNKTGVLNNFTGRSRRNGICQNDHGGPLVTWVGSHEVLIGIASVFKVSEESECIGPYLYTSTQCNGAFLDCILSNDEWPQTSTKQRGNKTRRALCKKGASDKGSPTIERHISWLYHPAGPADNEKQEVLEKSGSDIKLETTTKNENLNEYKNNRANDKYQEKPMYTLHKNLSGNHKSAPYERYTENAKFAPNERYAPNNEYDKFYIPKNGYAQNNVPLLNNRPVPYNRPMPINEPVSYNRPIPLYVPDIRPAPNIGPAFISGPAQNFRPAPNIRPVPNIRYGGNEENNNDELLIRPQFPLHI